MKTHKINLNKIMNFLLLTFKDKLLQPSGRELSVFVFVIVTIISWIAEQFFSKPVPQWMFLSFISLIAAGIGLYTFEPFNTHNSFMNDKENMDDVDNKIQKNQNEIKNQTSAQDQNKNQTKE